MKDLNKKERKAHNEFELSHYFWIEQMQALTAHVWEVRKEDLVKDLLLNIHTSPFTIIYRQSYIYFLLLYLSFSYVISGL
jgi:hypothetical protein